MCNDNALRHLADVLDERHPDHYTFKDPRYARVWIKTEEVIYVTTTKLQ